MLTTIFFGLLLISSCSGGTPKSVTEIPEMKEQNYSVNQKEEVISDSTLLCQINGVNWFYTTVRARKILSTDYKPRKKFSLNFKNENSPANENISLMYNAVTKQLEYVDMALQDPGAEQGRRIFSGISGYTEEETSQIKDIGVLTTISGDKISGNAEFLIPKKSKGVFKNEWDKDIVISNLRFESIQFEDESDY